MTRPILDLATLVLLVCAMQLMFAGHAWAGSWLFAATAAAYWLWHRRDRMREAVQARLQDLD